MPECCGLVFCGVPASGLSPGRRWVPQIPGAEEGEGAGGLGFGGLRTGSTCSFRDALLRDCGFCTFDVGVINVIRGVGVALGERRGREEEHVIPAFRGVKEARLAARGAV